MRSDGNLSGELRDSSEWLSNPLSDRSDEEVLRFSLPDEKRVRMSLSGKERNHLFVNEKGVTYTDVSGISGADSAKDGRSFAITDIDRDGFPDMILANTNTPLLQIFHNRSKTNEASGGNFVAFRFVGGNTRSAPSQNLSNRDGYGASVALNFADEKIIFEHHCGEGLAAQNSQIKLIGIGKEQNIPSAKIRWPSGKTQVIEHLKAGELVTVFEVEGESKDGSGFDRAPYLDGKSHTYRKSVEKRSLKGLSFKPLGHPNAKLVMYTSMATWCPSCLGHVPELNQLRTRFPDDTLAMVGVPVDEGDRAEMLNEFIKTTRAEYQLSANWEYKERELFKTIIRRQINTSGLPTTIITDGEGVVLEVMAGLPSYSDIVRLLSLDLPNGD